MSKSWTDENPRGRSLSPISFFRLQKHFYTLFRSHTLRIFLGVPRVAYSERRTGLVLQGMRAGRWNPIIMHSVAHRPLCLAQFVLVHLRYIAFEQVEGTNPRS